jgi:hypothetical protein
MNVGHSFSRPLPTCLMRHEFYHPQRDDDTALCMGRRVIETTSSGILLDFRAGNVRVAPRFHPLGGERFSMAPHNPRSSFAARVLNGLRLPLMFAFGHAVDDDAS